MSDAIDNSAIPESISEKPDTTAKCFSKRWWLWVFIVCVLGACYSAWQMWDINRFGHDDDGTAADCGIVLGAAAWHDKPSPVFKERINHAILLLKQKRIKGIILTGGYGDKAEYAESVVARDYCLKNGVLPEQIHIEITSQTTEQNITEASKIMIGQGFQTALIISDPWHLKRACKIAKHYGIEAKPSATRTSLYISEKSKSQFIWREFKFIHFWRFH